MDISTMHKTRFYTEASYIMQRATFSALQLGNLPLKDADVASAFDIWRLELMKRKGFNPMFVNHLADEVWLCLEKLGFQI